MADVKKTIKLDYKDNFDKVAKNLDKVGKNMGETAKIFSGLIKTINESLKKTTLELQKGVTKEMQTQLSLQKESLNIEKLAYSIRLKGVQESKKITAQYTEEANKINQKTQNREQLFGILRQRGILNKAEGLSRFGLKNSMINQANRIKEDDAKSQERFEKEYMASREHQRFEYAKENGIDNDPVMMAFSSKIDPKIKKYQDMVAKLTGDPKKKKQLAYYTGRLNKVLHDKEAVKLAVGKEIAEGEANVKSDYQEKSAESTGKSAVLIAKLASKGGWVGAIIAVLKKIGETIKKMGAFVEHTLGISLSIKKNFEDIVKNISDAFNMKSGMATFNTSTSLITNSQARELQMRYGLSSANTYALNRTMGIMNMQNDEDLMYMNRDQVSLFRSFMTKYNMWYDQLQSSGVLAKVQEAQLDIQMLKEEMTVDFLKWFAENKETILSSVKTIAKFVMDLTKLIAKITQWLLGGVASITGGDNGTASAAMSDYAMAKSLSGVRVVNVNVNQSNNATGVISDQSHMEQYFGEQMEKLSRELALQIT